jgi:hypothetical protein
MSYNIKQYGSGSKDACIVFIYLRESIETINNMLKEIEKHTLDDFYSGC